MNCFIIQCLTLRVLIRKRLASLLLFTVCVLIAIPSHAGPPSSTTTGSRVGLVLLAQFPDLPGNVTITQSQIDAFCNDPNYTEFGNATSVYGYFKIQSNGRLQYNSQVTAYFTAAHNRSYYTDNTIAFGTRAKELINEGLTALKAGGFDFTKCDADNNSALDVVSLFYAGDYVNSWSEGLWHHKWSSSWAGLSGEGVSTSFQYQITAIESNLSLGVFCRESGHAICGFPDLYSYDGNAANISGYSLMSTSGTTHPPHVDAYLKIHAGWANVIDITSASHFQGTLSVDNNTFYRFRNPGESREYFILSMRTNSGYEGPYGGAASATNPTNGLVIWHAREHGSNTYSSIVTSDDTADYSTPYELMVVEANPSLSTTPWYDAPYPGTNDGYYSGDVSEASDSTTPALKFWDTASGRTTTSNMNIHTVSAQGDVMSFTVGAGAVTGSPGIGLTPTALTSSCDYGTDATDQTFAVFNSNAGTLNYTFSEDASWLSLSASSGTATTEGDLITVSYDTDSLSAGTYNATITVTDGGATNSPETIPVTLTVNDQPVINSSSLTLTKSISAGESATDSFSIANSGGGTLYYTLSKSASWISLSTTSGTATAEEDEIHVVYDTHNRLGTYAADITISSTNAENTSRTINVTLIVSGHVIIQSPGGTETLWQDNKFDIRWITDGAVTGDVKIDLYKGGVLDSTVVDSTANDGFYRWRIPGGQTIGPDYRIRISSVDDGQIYGESPADFAMASMPTLVAIPYTEGFESDVGDWTQASDDNLNWTRDTSGTPSSATGPSTAQAGSYYIYTEASSPNYPTKSARLESVFDLRSATAPILSFYHHMYGATMGTLLIRASVDQKNWATLFSRSGNQGDSWQMENSDLSLFAGQAVMIQITGTTGSSYTSDIALDAVSISESTKNLSYSADMFTEASNDDGSILNSITINLEGDTFMSDAVSGGYITAINVPLGLTAQFLRDSSTQITFSLTGNADSHDNKDMISDLQVVFKDGSFTGGNASGITGNTRNISIDYMESTTPNNDPTHTGLPSEITVIEATESNLDLSSGTFSDVDSGANSISLTLTAISGTLSATDGGGVTVAGSGSGTLALSGAAADIDTFLNTADNIRYTGADAVTGNNADTITLIANDNGYTGIGGGVGVGLGSVTIDITAAVDSDTDGVPDHLDAFPDDPAYSNDRDNDGIPSAWENRNGLNPDIDDSELDPDEDGLSNLAEFEKGTDPQSLTSGPGIALLIIPDNVAIDQALTPTLETGYDVDAIVSEHGQTCWQIARDQDFTRVVLNITSEVFKTQVTVPREILDADTTYYWRVRYIDLSETLWAWSSPQSFTTMAALTTDNNNNGLLDSQEVPVGDFLDLDNDTFDDLTQADMHCLALPFGMDYICFKDGDNVTAVETFAHMSADIIEDLNGRPSDLPIGLLSFRLQVDTHGAEASITAYFSEPLPIDAVWYKYDILNGWDDYRNNIIISSDRKSLILKLIDGGYGDADGVANGIIVDPSGPAVAPTGSGGGGCFIDAITNKPCTNIWHGLYEHLKIWH